MLRVPCPAGALAGSHRSPDVAPRNRLRIPYPSMSFTGRNQLIGKAFSRNAKPIRRRTMADDSGASGLLGVLVGAILVLIVGIGVLYGTGMIGSNSAIKIETPRATTGSAK
jgi:hypothetical protein